MRTNPPPTLKTLRSKPSWHNRNGRIDRSACFVLTAARLWRRVHEDDWRYRVKQPPANRGASAGQARRLTKGLVDRDAELTLTARDLWQANDDADSFSDAMVEAFPDRPGEGLLRFGAPRLY